MRVTVFGATGLLGQALMNEWSHDEVSGLSSKDADIRDPDQVHHALERTRPDWVVLSAAYDRALPMARAAWSATL